MNTVSAPPGPTLPTPTECLPEDQQAYDKSGLTQNIFTVSAAGIPAPEPDWMMSKWLPFITQNNILGHIFQMLF